jgi:hypothetical protein
MEGFQRQQKAIYGSLSSDLAKTYREQAQEYMSFQLQIVKALKLRHISSHERLKDEMALVIKSLTGFLLSTYVPAIPLQGNFGNCARWRDLNLFG